METKKQKRRQRRRWHRIAVRAMTKKERLIARDLNGGVQSYASRPRRPHRSYRDLFFGD